MGGIKLRVILLANRLVAAGHAGFALATPALSVLASLSNPGNHKGTACGLSMDAAGNLYGTTASSGTGTTLSTSGGTVFELSGQGFQNYSTLTDFASTGAGSYLFGGVAFDSAGNLYGTTNFGGANGYGTVFELSGPQHQTLTTLISFTSVDPNPRNTLLIDSAGNIFGTTSKFAGNSASVFELSGTSHQTLTTLTTMLSAVYGGLIMDKSGNIYGTTEDGGANSVGSVFQLSGSNHKTFTTVYSFASASTGDYPQADLLMDSSGNIYGTTGGLGTSGGQTVFELSGTNHGTLTTLHSFNNDSPTDLLMDSTGNLYGTTYGNPYKTPAANGTVFELSGSDHQAFTTVMDLTGTASANPQAGLIADAAGNLYGTTSLGGTNNDGTVFEITGTAFVVPEPTGLSLLTLGGIALLRRRRIHKSRRT